MYGSCTIVSNIIRKRSTNRRLLGHRLSDVASLARLASHTDTRGTNKTYRSSYKIELRLNRHGRFTSDLLLVANSFEVVRMVARLVVVYAATSDYASCEKPSPRRPPTPNTYL